MSAKGILPGMVVVLLVAIVSFIAHQTITERFARTKLATLVRQQALLNAEIDRLSRSVSQDEKSVAELKSARAGPMAAAETVTPKPEAAPPTPEQIHITTLRAWLQLRNQPLYAKLGMSEVQIAKFEEVEMAHWLRIQDVVGTAKAESLLPNDPAIVALYKEETARFEREQAGALGESALKEVREYQRTLPVRTLANALAGNIFHTDPLTAEQGEQLTRILANNSASYRKGGPAKPAEIDSNAMLAQIQTVLTPEQFAAFKKPWLASQAGQKLSPLLAEAIKTAPAKITAPRGAR